MKILVKGGVWKNTEDEILKAAVMKYGKNQWARISSLLTRKTPKQCKARWFEWLDPSIKKTEWSKEEDEKLLHLAKLMPTQWRTIAPIVGRTPSQCLERYQRLLDEAESKEDADLDAGPNADEVRRLRPGEIDPEPESKPARPDPVDMDEDEKEMLSEARARLANTQGKKAKRKAREKQLEEARRLASLQKRRELKAAGIEVKMKPKRRGMDYNADIPFEKRAPAGFYAIDEEREREAAEKGKMTNVLLQKLEGKRRAEIEEEERKRDAKRQKTMKEKGEFVPPQGVRDAALTQKSERRKLVLPSPQVGEAEIEELMKIGAAADAAKAIADTDEGSASSALLTDYSALGPAASATATPIRTPRTPASTDALKIQARNLRAMEQSQTPLLGDSMNLEGDEAYSFEPVSSGGKKTMAGTAANSAVMHTPNPLASQLTPRAGPFGNQTPLRTPGGASNARFATPVRDQIGINTPLHDGFEETPRSIIGKQGMIRDQLSSLFGSLPKPRNEFDIIVPDVSKPADDEPVNATAHAVEDMADIEAREQRRKRAAEAEEMALRSTPVRRDLPRPLDLTAELDEIFNASTENDDSVEGLIRSEFARMIVSDMTKFPVPRQAPVPRRRDDDAGDTSLTSDELKAAEDLIKSELASIRDDDARHDKGEGDSDEGDQFFRIHAAAQSRHVFILPSTAGPGGGKEGTAAIVPGRFELARSTSSEDHVMRLSRDLEASRDLMKKEHGRAQGLEKKLATTLGGYIQRSTKLKRELAEQAKLLEDGAVQLESFRMLKTMEEAAAVERVDQLREELSRVEAKERGLQEKFKELQGIRDHLVRMRLAEEGVNGVGGPATNGF
ncbi:pre-mRNA splicing factor component-domain-containing protein [Zopfochytrium polystomum]|nr:pre-mRNA splicing factor component-domain-containing protein [Zopfochytrium polystomum]